MAEKVIINKSILTDIGNAIREKEESSDLIPSTEMATRIRDFQGGAKIISGGKSAVPVDGTTVVDKIFSDTSKSIEEVDAILSQLTYIDGLLGAGVGSYILFYGTSDYGDNIIFVNKITNPFGDGKDIYTIQTSDSSYLFYQNYDTDGNTFGWLIEDIPNGLRAGAPEFKINMASTTEIQGMPVGAQNELLKDIIYVGSAGVEKILKGEYNGDSVSITKPENVNISALIDEQKIPLAVNVDIPTYDGGYENGTQGDRLKKLLDTTKSCYAMFYNITGINAGDLLSYNDTENVTNMANMFSGYNGKIPDLNTSKVTNMANMFYGDSALTTIPKYDTSNVTNMSNMFGYCSSLIEIPKLDTSSVTDMSNMFKNCTKLSSILELDTSSCTTMDYMFSNCSALSSIPSMNTSKVKTMRSVFWACSALNKISNFDTSSCINFNNMFQLCTSLIEASFINMDSGSTTQFTSMFEGCTKLESVSGLNGKNAWSFTSTFKNCTNLTNLNMINILTNLQIGSGDGTGTSDYGTLLTVDSLVNTIKELMDTGSSKTLTMGTANLEKIENVYVKLTGEAEDEIYPKLPCEVCESTDEGAMSIIAYANSKNWTIA